jgi:hypothetical protein
MTSARATWLSALAAMLALAAEPAAAEVRSWNFRVLLDDRPIGEHLFTLRPAGEQLELRSEARFDVRVLFVNAYRYRHEALERWRGGCLTALESTTDANGEREAVRAIERGGRLIVARSPGREEHEGCVMSFAYWNPRILEARALLNSQTGELLPVTVQARGEEPVNHPPPPLRAQRYRIEAPRLQIDVWYSGDDWVALEAAAVGGRTLRYELI